VVHRTRVRLILAMVLALAQIAGWGIGVWAILNS